jgi:hypothetical protein
VIAHRKSSTGGPSKATEQQLAVEQVISYVATASAPLVWGTCLSVCSNTKARHSAQRVVQYLENLKDVEADREGTILPPLLQTSVLIF